LTDLNEIREYARQIVFHFNPEKIILFGSYAQGQPDAGSDVDLLVLMEFEGPPQDQAYQIRRALPRRFPVDLLVRRPQEVERRIQMGDFFLQEVLEKGRVLHERAGA
jgi:predicted nucleotidyltransferase